MFSKRNLLVAVTIFLALLPLVPEAQLADTNQLVLDNPKISSGLQTVLNTAPPDELVTVIVKLHATASFQGIQGQRNAVFTVLRQTATQSQANLVNELRLPNTLGKVGVIRQFWIDNIVLVQATKDIVEQIAARRDVKEVFENYTLTIPPRPQKASPREREVHTHQAQPWDNIAHIGAKDVWTNYGFTGNGIRVGGLDTGVDISHPDIAGKMLTNNPADPTYPGGWGEFDSNGNFIPGTFPHDSDEHGTHTSGTMIGGNASGWDIGVAPGAQLMHGLVIPGGSGSFAQVAGGMEWIIDPDGNPGTDDGAHVVNMSLGGTGTHDAMVTPTDNMVAAGVFPSFSIGNAGPGSGTTGSPGNVPSACGVGSTDSGDVIAGSSSRGPVTWNTPPYVGTYIKPDMSAPGVQVFSTVPGGEWEWTSPLGDWSGTSMAAPHLAGTVALMRQANPSLSVDDIKQLLAQTALDLGDPGKDNDYGFGRVNAFAAVSAALAGVGTLTGTVSSSGGGPVEDATVLVTDTGQKVKTDAAGNYTLQMVAGDHTVEYSAFGFDSESVLVTVVADASTTQDVTLNQLPSGSVAGTVSDAATLAGVGAGVNVYLAGELVKSSSSDGVTGAYYVELPVGTYDLVFSPPFPYPVTTVAGVTVVQSATTTVDVALVPAQILIVDDDGGDSYEAYYEAAVIAAGRSFLTVNAPPVAADMAAFGAVVWLTGDDYTTTLTTADQAELAAFLDGGGKLFISGQDIGYDINGDAFYSDYLHAAYVQDNVGLGGVIGDPASPVGFGFALDIQGGSGANNQAYPSEIDPVGLGTPAFLYDETVAATSASANRAYKSSVSADGITSSGTAGLSVDDGTYRLVYFAFGFEAIADATGRAALMDRILDWLQGFPEIAHTPLGDTEDTANPYHVTAVITSEVFPLDPASFAVVYDAGLGTVSLPMTATATPDEYEAYIPAQPTETLVQYYITASDVEGHTSTDPLGAPMNTHAFNVAKDTEAPSVAHIPHSNTNDLGGPYGIKADVSDNIGVGAVYLMYWKNAELLHRIEMMLEPDGFYHAAIPGPSEVGDVYNYFLLAMDNSYSGNVTRLPDTGHYSFEIVEEFVWDFETDDGGWVQTGDIWEWGAPTTGPGGAHSGVNAWATRLAGDYPSSANATLDVPAITLAADKPYSLFSFWHWYNIETNYDGGNVKVSADGGVTFDVVTPVGGYDGTATSGNAGVPGEEIFTGNQGMWEERIFDLSAYTGQSVMIRFHFGSDSSVQRPGWYVDLVTLRSTDTDDLAPVFSDLDIPSSTFDTAGPYAVSARVTDLLSGVGMVSLFYSTDDGANYTEVAMAPGVDPDVYEASIPGQSNGTRVKLYMKATDNAGNETLEPATAPADGHGFAILPSASILAMVSATTGTSLDDFRTALEANGHEADYWNMSTQGSEILDNLELYETIILDERSSISSTEQAAYADFLNSGAPGSKKGFFLMGRDLAFFSSTRPWIGSYMRADYVQDDPSYREISGEPGDPIGADETFVISGSYPDEVQRSSANPGGEIVYRFTAEGTSLSRSEIEGAYLKAEKEWDGVMPHAPKSLDAAAGMKYNAGTYRSIYFTFNFDYIQEPTRRAGIVDRVIGWIEAPEIDHTALSDTEDTTSAYTVAALIYSDNLDASRVNLTYDVGGGAVTVLMTPTATPDEYAADIPPQTFGTTVSYYISAANTDGNTSLHPAGAPTDQHSFDVTADNTPPEIVHSPMGFSADLTGPYTIQATVTDNVGVDPAGVSLTHDKNGGSATTIAMTNVSGDLYTADIPGPSTIGDIYNYFIIARDIAAVPNTTRDPVAGTHALEIVDFFAWDFEANDGGFAAGGPDWEWGAPTVGPDSAHSGDNVWATKLGADYSASSNSTLDIPAVIVPSSAAYAQLSFWQWYYNETGYDGGNVKLSTDGGTTWTILTPDIGYTGTASSGNAAIPGEPCFTGYNNDVWHKATFDLTAYKGMSVLVRLHFGSDSSVQRVGWYVDDVRIEGVDDTEGPVFASTSVPSGTFDTVGPYTVTTTVLDALSGVAGVTMYYSTDDGSSYTPVAMTSAGGNDYTGDIPGQTSGTRIKIYLEAADNAANTTLDPAGAPASTYEFGVMPSGDYLVLLGGASHATPVMFQQAFSSIGRTADIWDWDDLGMPTVAILEAYTAVVIDESWYFDTTQQDTLGAWLSTIDGSGQKVFILGRDLSFGSTARAWMEEYTGTTYIQDSSGFLELTSTPGDPIGNDETFVISGSYPDEVALSTTYTGGQVVYKYSGTGSARDLFDSAQELREFYEKSGKDWDPRLWPMAPLGADSAAAVRFTGPNHASVYFCFNFNYIQEDTRRAAILDRVLTWLDTAAATKLAANGPDKSGMLDIPDRFVLGQNYPNPFNPVTSIRMGVPTTGGRVSLRVYNVRGQLVATLFDGNKTAGYHTFQWDGTSNGEAVSSGVYFVRLENSQAVLTRKMVLLK